VVLDLGLVLAAGGFVSFHGGLRRLDMGLGDGKFGLDLLHLPGQRGYLGSERSHAGIGLLQVNQL